MSYQKPISIDEAKHLKMGQILYSRQYINRDGSPQQWRVNGRVERWRAFPEKILVLLKRGTREYGHLTEKNLWLYSLSEQDET